MYTRIIKLRSFLLFVFISITVSLAHADSRRDLIQAVDNFYDWANATYGKPGTPAPSPTDLKKNLGRIFDPDIVHRLNGTTVATSVSDLVKRFTLLHGKYQYVLVKRPFDECVVDSQNDTVAIRYQIAFHQHDGGVKTIYALTTFKVKNHKLTEFNEVSSVARDHLS